MQRGLLSEKPQAFQPGLCQLAGFLACKTFRLSFAPVGHVECEYIVLLLMLQVAHKPSQLPVAPDGAGARLAFEEVISSLFHQEGGTGFLHCRR